MKKPHAIKCPFWEQTWPPDFLSISTPTCLHIGRHLRPPSAPEAAPVIPPYPSFPLTKLLVSVRKNIRRGVAQPGSAPASGAGGRKFESFRPDQKIQGGLQLCCNPPFPFSSYSSLIIPLCNQNWSTLPATVLAGFVSPRTGR